MPESNLVSQVNIKIGGVELQRGVMVKLVSVSIDQHTHLPDLFILRFNDPGLELINGKELDLTKEVEISAEREDGQSVVLTKGEITAIEPNFGEGMTAELVVRGYDKSHRLYRETKTKAYVNVKDSDLARDLAGQVGLQAVVDATSTVYDHIFQHNQTDLEFLRRRAWRIGYECFVEQGKLYFRKPVTSGSHFTLTWGSDLTTFRPRMSLSEQVDEVIVRGWDAEQQKPLVGRASSGKLSPKIQETRSGTVLAGPFGKGKKILVDQPVVSQAEADLMAAARMDELSGAFLEAEGTALRRPDLRAGRVVEIEGLGTKFTGKYLITRAIHVVSPEGLKTTISVTGSRLGILGEQLRDPVRTQQWPGVVTAVVTNTDDPKKWGRVKVKYPWMSEDAESDWARVIGIGAGKGIGFYSIPSVGDEVMVAFDWGDFGQPVVLGGVWHGKAELPGEVANAKGGNQPRMRTWHSILGHYILFNDVDKRIEIQTSNGLKITMDEGTNTITLKSPAVKIDLKQDKLVVESSGEVSIKGTNVKLEASMNLDIKANGQVNINGAMVNLNS